MRRSARRHGRRRDRVVRGTRGVARRSRPVVTGSLRVVATRSGERTILDTLRQEGLARCSRPFALPSGAARIVTMQLGPGYVRGDHFECIGYVGARAELDVVPQAATRALGRGAESFASNSWTVGAGGTLQLLGEPLVLYDGARHRATLDVELGAHATFVYADVIVACGPFAGVSTRLRVRSAAQLLVHDALSLSPRRLQGAVGSGLFLVCGLTAPESQGALAAADAAASAAQSAHDVRIGIGSPARGGVAIRALGSRAANVRAAVLDVLAAVGRFRYDKTL